MIRKNRIIPEEWKKSASILKHKKVHTINQKTSRLFTLQTVPLKIFTACMQDTIFDFVMGNTCIDCKLQKGFLPKVSGTFKHTAHVTHTINLDQKKQRSVVITLLDQ